MKSRDTARGSRAVASGLLLLAAACASEGEPTASGTSPAGVASPVPAQAGAMAVSPSAQGGAGGAGTSLPASPPASLAGAGGDTSQGPGGTGASVADGAGAPVAGTGGAAAPAVESVPTLYWLDIGANRVMRSQDFAPGEAIVSPTGTAPDGVAVDVEGGKVYWTNMGSPLGTGGGSLQRANLDGSEVETIVPPGIAQTPKQMQLDLIHRHVYFCDREGAKVWRAGMDGSDPEAIVSGHGLQELVGVALDVPAGKLYFSDRIGRKILRANLELPAGETGANRTDIEELVVLPSGAMPIDLDIDHVSQRLYWTDRQLGTVQRVGLDLPAGQSAAGRSDLETLVTDLVEPIGISLDVAEGRVYFTELGGSVSASALDGTDLQRDLLSSSSATGVSIAHVPVP